MSGAQRRPYAATTYEVLLAMPKAPGYDWRTVGTTALSDLDLRLRLASGLEPMLAVVRAIESGSRPGRKVDWGAWVGPVAYDEIGALLQELGGELPAGTVLDPDATYLVAAIET
jgi:hypothetical protein